MLDLYLAAPRCSDDQASTQHLDLEVLTGFLRRAGFDVALDAIVGESPSTAAVVERLGRLQARAEYWHLPSQSSFRILAGVADALRSRPHTPTLMVGGHFASLHDLRVLEILPQVDAVVRGELELPLLEVLRRLTAGDDWESCSNLTVRGEQGPIRNSFDIPPIDPARLPRAADDLFHPSRRENGQQVLFGRGCNSNCGYCTLQVVLREGHSDRERFWRSRPAAAIVDEIEYYCDRHEVRRFVFMAGVFFGYDERGSQVVEQVAREILRRGLDIRFKIVTHPGHLVRNRKLLPLLKEAGLDLVYLGIDSGAQGSLRRFAVAFDQADALAALELLHDHRLAFTPGFIFFEPQMDLTDLEEQLRFLRRAEPFFSHLSASYPWYLERYLLGSSLEIKPSMPLLRVLREDSLVSDEGSLWESPRVRFRHAAVARFSRFWRETARHRLAALRPLLWNRFATDVYPSLRTFPLDFLNQALGWLRAQNEMTPDELSRTTAAWVRESLADELPAMMTAARLNERQRQRVATAVFDRVQVSKQAS